MADKMQFVPWQYVADWKCSGCGMCCKLYSVVLNFHEWLGILKNYGADRTAADISKLYLQRKGDGSCTFLYDVSDAYLCGLQHMKPKACKLWPFKILGEPKYGYPDKAAYSFGENRFYVYVDSSCEGLSYGAPRWEFANCTLKEFVEIAAGLRSEQYKTTAKIGSFQPYPRFRV